MERYGRKRLSLIRVISNSVLLMFLTNILSSSYASLFKPDTVSAKTVLTEVSSVLRYDAEVNIQSSDSVENKEAVLEVTEANKDNSKIDNEKKDIKKESNIGDKADIELPKNEEKDKEIVEEDKDKNELPKVDEDRYPKEDLTDDGNITKKIDIYDAALVGILLGKDIAVNDENILISKNSIPAGNGVWILEKDRDIILRLINSAADKEYYVDENGFLRCTEKAVKGSKSASDIIDGLIANEKTLVLGRSDGWNEYDYKEEKVLRQGFTEENKGVTIGGKATNQIVIIDENIECSTENSMILVHELIHGLRGEEGHKDRLEEEAYASNLENVIRKELELALRDTSKIDQAYEDLNSSYRDDYNNIAFTYSDNYYGTVRLSDPSSYLNIRKGPSTNYDIIGTVTHGSVVQVLEKRGDWYYIRYESTVGYIRQDFIMLGSAEGASTGVVKLNDPSSSLNIRSGASTDTSIVGSVGHGTVISILGTEGNWYKISYNGTVGYVRSDYVTLGSGAGNADGKTGTIRLSDPSSSLNVRSGPSTGTSVIGSLAHGTAVTIFGTEGDWYRINYNGTTGYVRNDYVIIGCVTSGTTGTIRLNDPSSSLNVRSGASTDTSVIGSLSHGASVQILETVGNWYQIAYNGGIGYVRNDFVSLTTGSASTAGSGTGTVRLQDPSSSLNVRSGASINSSVIGSLPHGAAVQIVGSSGEWYQISYNGATGYVRQDYIIVGGTSATGGTGTVNLRDPSSSLNVRSGPSITSSIIGSLPHGASVTIVGKSGEWYQINYNGMTGYIRQDYVIAGGGSVSGAGQTGTIRLNDPSSSLNVRSGPSTSTSIIGSLSHGSVIQIIGTSGEWYAINYNGTTGYVRGDYVALGSIGGVSSSGGSFSCTFKDGIRYYAQDDPRYGGQLYSTHGDSSQTIASSACGPSAFSIVVSTLNKIDAAPPEICNYALANGYRTYNSGTSSSMFGAITNDSRYPQYRLNCEYAGSTTSVKNYLSDGKHLVIASMAPGHVTRNGHYIVLAGTRVLGGKTYFEVYDPHQWNEYYVYDSELIDYVKNDGFILLSENVIRNEANSYTVFSSKSGTGIKVDNIPSSGNSSGSGSSSGGNDFSGGGSDISDKEKSDLVKAAISMGIDCVPIAGDLKNVIEVFLGRDILTGTELNRGALIACMIIPGGLDKLVSKGFKGGKELSKIIDACSDLEKTEAKNLVKESAKLTKYLKPELLNELAKSGVKYTAEDVMMVTKMADGKLVWLEKGSESAGFQHILKHSEQLADRGISKDNIIDVMYELLNTTPIGTGSNAKGRYADYLYNNKVTRICYGDNGFIVSMFPRD